MIKVYSHQSPNNENVINENNKALFSSYVSKYVSNFTSLRRKLLHVNLLICQLKHFCHKIQNAGITSL